jgi:asparagine synthase (glutamine-hydrolysing)
MCGILGVLKFDGSPVDAPLLRRMRDSLTHRGPDDEGLFVQPGIGLGHRRLSILDLSANGHQPMTNEDGSIWLVFNGEIYNYIELRARLRQRGHAFRSDADTEVIIHLYEELGERCLTELSGMFAFVLWDARRKLLFGARDRFGIKPFYYYKDRAQFVCASEIKAIVEDPSVVRKPDERGIADYLFAGAPLGGKTFFDGIHELPPAHRILVRDGQVHVSKYWDLRYEYQDARPEKQTVGDIADLLADSVRIHCRSDAPVGCHLSGGIDSSSVTSLAAQHIAPLNTFSIRFDGGTRYDETAYAKRVAAFVGSQYHETTGDPEFLASVYASLIWHMDQPPAGGVDAGFSYYMAARLAADHVKVALTGHGGDEIFAGYPRHLQTASGTAAPDAFARAPTLPLPERARRVLRAEGLSGLLRRVGARLWPNGSPSPEAVWLQTHCGIEPRLNPLLQRGFRTGLGEYSPRDQYLAPFREAPTEHLLDRCLYHDQHVYLPTLLHKEDRASMAVSIESRVPLLDHRIAEYMATVPSKQKLAGGVLKALLRKAMGGRLPDEIIGRRDKLGFQVPVRDWLGESLQPLATRIVSSPACLDRGIFDADMIRGGRLGPAEVMTIMNVEIWYRIFMDRDSTWLAETGAASRAAAGAPARPGNWGFAEQNGSLRA